MACRSPTSSCRARRAPPVEAVALIAEVSASTLDIDLGPKPAIYAAAGVPEYWVIDLEGRRAHRMRIPGADGYATSEAFDLGERLESATIAGLAVGTVGLA